MNTKFLFISSLLLLAIFVTACAGQPTTTPNTPKTESPGEAVPSPTEAQGSSVEDYDSLVSALQTAGATVEPGDEVEQVFFSETGRIIKVNGADVQVFEYETPEAMEPDAAQVSEDGGSIGTTMVTWVEAPHFFKAGRIIVLYVGTDQAVLELLAGALGPQFAGH